MQRIVWLLTVVAWLAACDRRETVRQGEAAASTAARRPATLDARIRALAAWRGRVGDAAADSVLRDWFAPYADSGAVADTAVVRLVACMARTEPSGAVVHGQPVLVGALCHAALQQFVYHEEVGADGGLTAEWAGDIGLAASPTQIRAAYGAWSEVVRQRTYATL